MNKYIIASTFVALMTTTTAYAATTEVDQEVGDSAILVTAEEYAAQAGTSCRKKRVIKTDDSVCSLLKKPEDMNPAKLPGAAQNPFTGGCDFSAFEFPGLPSFGGGLGGLLDGGFAEETLCDLAEGLVNPMIGDVNNNILGDLELMLFDVTGQTLTSDGQIINTGGGSSPASYLDTVNQIKNVLKAVK
jgi:hypothetical protein